MILIIDFGSQTAHLIGRRLRDIGVSVEYIVPEDAMSAVQKFRPTGIIFSGGPSSVYEAGAPTIDPDVFTSGVPILGICYGWHIMAKLLGGKVVSGQKEYGPARITFQKNIFKLPKKSFSVIMSHGDTVTKLPKDFEVVGTTASVPLAAVACEAKRLYGILFHPEAHHSEQGKELLRHFAVTICGEALNPLVLDPAPIITDIKNTVGNAKVICAVSGGVDSTVAAALIAKAIGKQLIAVYVESGLMREHTQEAVKKLFSVHVKATLVVIEARARFMKALKGVTDPEVKRKTIGKLYIELFDEEAKKHIDVQFLGQGTIYSDVIESKGSKHASHIKSHHNVGGLPKDMKLKLLEPMRAFYKDEVREIGRKLSVPEEFVSLHPFPGPGYAIRIRGEVTEKRLSQEKAADKIVMEEMRTAGFYHKVFQCFAVLTGAYSTAVKGDGRVFAEVVAVRAYESTDVMTDQWADLPYAVLAKISSRIVNEVPDISRVVYDITNKPPATMEWE
ncbi:MAG: glutamine-hydrolyzing GMP synthase [Candidatus Woesebacteria bacterium]